MIFSNKFGFILETSLFFYNLKCFAALVKVFRLSQFSLTARSFTCSISDCVFALRFENYHLAFALENSPFSKSQSGGLLRARAR